MPLLTESEIWSHLNTLKISSDTPKSELNEAFIARQFRRISNSLHPEKNHGQILSEYLAVTDAYNALKQHFQTIRETQIHSEATSSLDENSTHLNPELQRVRSKSNEEKLRAMELAAANRAWEEREVHRLAGRQ
jgi:hypothetical protein